MNKRVMAALISLSVFLTSSPVYAQSLDAYAALTDETEISYAEEITEEITEETTAEATQEGTEEGNPAVPIDEEYHGYVELPHETESINEGVPRLRMSKANAIPAYYDARENAQVTSVKDQNPYGTCWSFSTMAALESSLLSNQTFQEIDLSEYHLVHYAFRAVSDPLQGTAEDHVQYNGDITQAMQIGGNVLVAYHALTNWMGAVEEDVAAYPGYGKVQELSRTVENAYLQDVAHVQQFFKISSADVSSIKQSIMQYGALAMSLYYSNSYLDNGTGAYYCKSNILPNHAVTVVGWDDDYSRTNFKTDPGEDGAWLIKNSWGTGFGNDGYFWLSYKDHTIGDTFSVVVGEEASNYDNNYQYDGSYLDQYVSDSNKLTAANVFRVQDGQHKEKLRAVSFDLSSTNTQYSIQVYKDLADVSNPESGEPVLSQPVTGSTTFQGYYTVSLPEDIYLEPGESFSVVITFERSGSVRLTMEDTGYWNGIQFTAGAKEGQSFLKNKTNDSWQDVGKSAGCNIRIKAFTNNTDQQDDSAFIIVKQPKEQSVWAGEEAVFAVEVSGAEALSYQWQYSKDQGQTWTDHTSNDSKTAVLRVVGEDSLDQYLYRCVVTDQEGHEVISKAAKLIVLQVEEIKITKQPVDQKVTEGQQATFYIEATGTGDLSYQWQQSADQGNTWENETSADGKKSVLHIVGTSALNQYLYRCVVTDRYGNEAVSEAAQLTVKEKEREAIKFLSQPKDQTVFEGQTASFSISASGEGTLRCQWQYSADNGQTWVDDTSAYSKSATLRVVGAQNLNQYLYRCVVSNNYGDQAISKAAKLTVEQTQPITIFSQPKDQKVVKGQTAYFSISASGTGTLRCQWQYSADNGQTWVDDTSAYSKSATLRVVGTSDVNDYLYRCVVTNNYGSQAISSAARLTVDEKNAIQIIKQPTDQKVLEGQTAYFTIGVTGIGMLSCQWQYSKDNGNTWENETSTNSQSALLMIAGRRNLDQYLYRCVITDSYGNQAITQTARLTVEKKPPITIFSQPTDQKVFEGQYTYFLISATGTGLLDYQWQYSRDNGETWENMTSFDSKTSLILFRSEHDQNGYLYRCMVKDAQGDMAVSDAAKLEVIRF